MATKRFIVEMDEGLADVLKNSGQIKISEGPEGRNKIVPIRVELKFPMYGRSNGGVEDFEMIKMVLTEVSGNYPPPIS